MPDLAARPLSPQALRNLLDRKPHLLRPLALQLLPPLRAPIDPAKRLGIDMASVRTVEDFRPLLSAVLAAVARGEIAPSEAAFIAKRVEARLRAVRRLASVGQVNSGEKGSQKIGSKRKLTFRDGPQSLPLA